MVQAIERWVKLDIDARYSVSSLGQIKSDMNGILKYKTPLKGYMKVKIKGKYYAVHRLVAKAFIPNPLNFPEVNHLDALRANNCATNLEWCSQEQNMKHAVRLKLHLRGEQRPHKLNEKDVLFIRQAINISQKELSLMYAVSVVTINEVIRRKTWAHI